ncbi:MAG: PilZ domain-containing protein [Acidobacteria bacterium]|nr:PilZ domain-containing protein [Acidobacteriota bacterium]
MSFLPRVKDKRRFVRVGVRHIVSFAHLSDGLPKEPMSGLGRTLDVGAGGARLETDRPLEIGEHLVLEIALGSQIVHAEATVVHVSSTTPDMVAAGLAFDRIPAPDRETLTALGF